jgi:hypothetical protein
MYSEDDNISWLRTQLAGATKAEDWNRAAELTEQIVQLELKQQEEREFRDRVIVVGPVTPRLPRIEGPPKDSPIGKLTHWQMHQLADAMQENEYVMLHHSDTALWATFESGGIIAFDLAKT